MILYFVFDKIEIEETIGLGLIFFCYNVILFMYSAISFLSSILNVIPVCRLYQIFEEKKMKNLSLLARIQIAFLFIYVFPIIQDIRRNNNSRNNSRVLVLQPCPQNTIFHGNNTRSYGLHQIYP